MGNGVLFLLLLFAVFILSFGFFMLLSYTTSCVYERHKIKKRLRTELLNGARYGYVCETVYPDIAGKVIIGGRIFSAESRGKFERGDVVLCREDNGRLVIPLIFQKKVNKPF